jgi:peptidylprolyl isomerase
VKRFLALLLLPVLLLAAACGSSGEEASTSDTSAPDSTDTTATDSSTTAAPADLPAGATIVSVGEDLEAKPEVELEASDTAPTEVVIEDVIVGDGAEAEAADTVEVQYVGMLTDGTEFDSSWDRGTPATFPLDGVITGWGEGLVGMKEGGRRTLVIPAEKGYGDTGTSDGSIPPGATLVFVVDLISVQKPAPAGADVTSVTDDLTTKPEIEVTPADAPTEVVVEDIVVGDGDAVVAADDPRIEAHYVAYLTDGTEVDSSWEGETPIEANLSQLVPGWSEGLDGMKVGGRRVIVLPADQAYGETGTPDGTIPPGATLIYVVDLVSLPA